MPAATTAKDLDLIAPGSRMIVRDLEWQVVEGVPGTRNEGDRPVRRPVRAGPRSAGAFLSDLDEIKPEDPKRTNFRLDASPNGIEVRLIESLIRQDVASTALMIRQALV